MVKTEEVVLAGVVRPDILGGGGRGLELMVANFRLRVVFLPATKRLISRV